jgi:hypothetical protein
MELLVMMRILDFVMNKYLTTDRRLLAITPVPRRRIVVLMLALSLLFSSSGQIYTAQAAPAREGVTFYMDIVNPKTTVCVGKSVNYEARVYMVFNPPLTTPKGNKVDRNAIAGIKVDASSADPNVGDIVGRKQGPLTRVTGGAEDLVNLNNPDPVSNSATFKFKAKKAGKTTLYFEGSAYGQYVSFNVPVTVIPCKFKVISTSNMATCYPGGCIKFRGVIVDGQVVADENGYFTGNAPVVWISSSVVPKCGAVNTLGISNVMMRGNLDETGQLKLELEYKPVQFSDVVKCALGSGAGSEKISVSGLQVTMPSESKLLAVKLPQQLSGGPGGVSGKADVFVIPLDGAK